MLLLATALLAGHAPPAGAQAAVAKAAGSASAPTAPTAPVARDPLERETPRKALTAFARSVNQEDYTLAAQYAQLTRPQQREAESLLRGLKEIIDRYLTRPLSAISDAPEGALNDGLPPERERIGPLNVEDKEFYVDLVRVSQGGTQVWLISSDTLRLVPRFHSLLVPPWAERVLPAAVTAQTVFGVSLVRFAVWAASLVVPLVLLHFLLPAIGAGIMRVAAPWPQRAALGSWLAQLRWPLTWLVTLAVHWTAIPEYGGSLSFRLFYLRVVLVLLVAAVAWAVQRVLKLVFAHARGRLQGNGRMEINSLLLLGERLLNVAVVVIALLAVLALCGLDIRAALAGLGIVGFAVALGAKKTVENILGGMMLLGDQALAVGDDCRISGREGRVEDITLRSVRIRTPEQTLLSIPSGMVAEANIENYTTRRKFLACDKLRLTHQTTAMQVRKVRDGIERLLRAQALIEQETARIRLIGFAVQGIELEFFAYFMTADRPRFLAAREELLLQIAGVVEAAGSGFAVPVVQVERVERVDADTA